MKCRPDHESARQDHKGLHRLDGWLVLGANCQWLSAEKACRNEVDWWGTADVSSLWDSARARSRYPALKWRAFLSRRSGAV